MWFFSHHFSFFFLIGMKVCGFLVAMAFLSTTDAIMKTRFRAMKCTSFNETYVSMKCFLKAYSRTYVIINSIETRKVKYEKPIEVIFHVSCVIHCNRNDFGRLKWNWTSATELFITKCSIPSSNGAASWMEHQTTSSQTP